MQKVQFREAIKAIWKDKGFRSPFFLSQILMTGGFVALRSLDVVKRVKKNK